MKTLLKMTAIATLAFVAACTSQSQDITRLLAYDNNTKYEVDTAGGNFVARVTYINYQFVPDSPQLATKCRNAAASVVRDVSAQRGIKLEAFSPLQVSTGVTRNAVTGETSCEATISVKIIS